MKNLIEIKNKFVFEKLYTLNINPYIIWMCGHGYLRNKKNHYILEGYFKNRSDDYTIDEDEFGTALEKLFTNNRNNNNNIVTNNKRAHVIIGDFCNSATILNLKYYYIDYLFYEKVNDTERQYFTKKDDPLIIYISAARDSDTTSETSDNGGLFSFKLVNFLKSSRKMCLNDLLLLVPKDSRSAGYNVIISCSKIIDPNEYYINLE